MVKTIVNALPPPPPKDVYKETAGGQWSHPKGCVLCTVLCVHIHCWGVSGPTPKDVHTRHCWGSVTGGNLRLK